jgi:hypothetical protein
VRAIVELGAWVIRNACLAAAKWPGNISVAINLSPVQFDNPGLVQTVAAALAETGLEPSRLELAITESVLLHDSAVNIAVLDELSELGVSIPLDDFGTGYPSLSYLRRFSFDRIKIDHSFVRDITRNEGSLKIVRAIVISGIASVLASSPRAWKPTSSWPPFAARDAIPCRGTTPARPPLSPPSTRRWEFPASSAFRRPELSQNPSHFCHPKVTL